VGKIYMETKARPRYIVEERIISAEDKNGIDQKEGNKANI